MKLILSLEREGGHIIVLFLLVILCIALSYLMPENALVTKCGDLALGALLLAMKGSGNGKLPIEPALAELKPLIAEFGKGPLPNLILTEKPASTDAQPKPENEK